MTIEKLLPLTMATEQRLAAGMPLANLICDTECPFCAACF